MENCEERIEQLLKCLFIAKSSETTYKDLAQTECQPYFPGFLRGCGFQENKK